MSESEPPNDGLRRTARGFRVYAEFVDTYGATVDVVASSLATERRVWLHVRPDGATATVPGGNAHLDADGAVRVRDALDTWLAEFHPDRSRGLAALVDERRYYELENVAQRVLAAAFEGEHAEAPEFASLQLDTLYDAWVEARNRRVVAAALRAVALSAYGLGSSVSVDDDVRRALYELADHLTPDDVSPFDPDAL